MSFKYSYNNNTINAVVLDLFIYLFIFFKKSLSSLFFGHRFPLGKYIFLINTHIAYSLT